MDSQDSIQSIYGASGRAATLDVYAQQLINSFDDVTGEVDSSQAPFVSVLLQMHPWFTTSVGLFHAITRNSLQAVRQSTAFDSSFEEMKRGVTSVSKDTDKINNCCTCSDLQLRRRNNRYLSRLMFDEPGLKISVTSFRTESADSIAGLECSRATGLELMAPNSLRTNPTSHCRQVCFAVRYWMQKFPIHFEPGTKLFTEVGQFREQLQIAKTELHELISSDDIPSYDWMRKATAKVSGSQRADSQNKISLVFHNLSSEDLAKHLSYIDYKACRRIPFAEYKCYAHSGKMSNCNQLQRSVTILNGLTQWVQLMVLSKTHPRQRAAIVSKFIRVSQHLVRLKCYNTCMAVVGGISHSSIARLHKTYSYIGEESLKALEELSELLSARQNYQNYRKAAGRVVNGSYSLPIIGVHLKDLVAIHTAQSDTVEGDPQLINFQKLAQLYSVISCLTKLHDNLPDYSVNSDLIATLKLALDVFYSEEEIFELSLAREPRLNLGGAKEGPRIADQQNLLSEWQTGLKPPDKDTVSKHVSNMVTAIFKNYDLDRDGYISVEEFEMISSNFPFIESSFCVLDVSDNGLLSEGEVNKYFTLAKCSSLKRSFKHNFTETTYFKLTYCEHCSGLLWGLIKQGWKCRDCGINAHKSCKDRVVMDCKPKTVNNGLTKTTSSAPISGSTSNSALSCSSPLTPSTPELSHNEPRFTFSRLSTKSAPSSKGTATPFSEDNSLSPVGDATTELAAVSLTQSCPLSFDTDVAGGELLTMKLLEYERLLAAKEKELERQREEKKRLEEYCLDQSKELLALKQQLRDMKAITAPLSNESTAGYRTLLFSTHQQH